MKHKTILFFVSIGRRYYYEQLDGIFRHPGARDWHVQVVPMNSAAAMRKAMDFWRPSGVIAEHGDALKFPPSLFGKIPTVLIDIGKRLSPNGFNVVKLDSAATKEWCGHCRDNRTEGGRDANLSIGFRGDCSRAFSSDCWRCGAGRRQAPTTQRGKFLI